MRLLTGAPMENQFDVSHIVGHSISVVAILLSFAGILPAIASLAAVIWYGIQIYESETVQTRIDRWKKKRKARLIAKIRAKQKVLLAELEALEVIQTARAAASETVARATTEAAKELANAHAHQKIHNGGVAIKSIQER